MSMENPSNEKELTPAEIQKLLEQVEQAERAQESNPEKQREMMGETLSNKEKTETLDEEPKRGRGTIRGQKERSKFQEEQVTENKQKEGEELTKKEARSLKGKIKTLDEKMVGLTEQAKKKTSAEGLFDDKRLLEEIQGALTEKLEKVRKLQDRETTKRVEQQSRAFVQFVVKYQTDNEELRKKDTAIIFQELEAIINPSINLSPEESSKTTRQEDESHNNRKENPLDEIKTIEDFKGFISQQNNIRFGSFNRNGEYVLAAIEKHVAACTGLELEEQLDAKLIFCRGFKDEDLREVAVRVFIDADPALRKLKEENQKKREKEMDQKAFIARTIRRHLANLSRIAKKPNAEKETARYVRETLEAARAVEDNPQLAIQLEAAYKRAGYKEEKFRPPIDWRVFETISTWSGCKAEILKDRVIRVGKITYKNEPLAQGIEKGIAEIEKAEGKTKEELVERLLDNVPNNRIFKDALRRIINQEKGPRSSDVSRFAVDTFGKIDNWPNLRVALLKSETIIIGGKPYVCTELVQNLENVFEAAKKQTLNERKAKMEGQVKKGSVFFADPVFKTVFTRILESFPEPAPKPQARPIKPSEDFEPPKFEAPIKLSEDFEFRPQEASPEVSSAPEKRQRSSYSYIKRKPTDTVGDLINRGDFRDHLFERMGGDEAERIVTENDIRVAGPMYDAYIETGKIAERLAKNFKAYFEKNAGIVLEPSELEIVNQKVEELAQSNPEWITILRENLEQFERQERERRELETYLSTLLGGDTEETLRDKLADLKKSKNTIESAISSERLGGLKGLLRSFRPNWFREEFGARREVEVEMKKEGSFDITTPEGMAKLDIKLQAIEKSIVEIEEKLTRFEEKRPLHAEVLRKFTALKAQVFEGVLPIGDLQDLVRVKIEEKLRDFEAKPEDRQKVLDNAKKLRDEGEGIDPFQNIDESALQGVIDAAFGQQVEEDLLKAIEKIKPDRANDELLRWAKRNMTRSFGSRRGRGEVKTFLLETIDGVLSSQKIPQGDARRLNLVVLRQNLDKMS